MKRPQEIALEQESMQTIVSLTNAFEGLASMRIMRSKSRVLRAREFFDDIWQIYSQIRVSDEFGYGRSGFERAIHKELYILITAEAGLSGDIDQRLVTCALEKYDKHRNDIVVVGRRGQTILNQRDIKTLAYFKLPEKDDFNVEPVAEYVRKYRSTKVFYQDYESLTSQSIKTIDLGSLVKSHEDTEPGEEVINEASYIFEPSVGEVVAYFERSMVRLTLMEVILDSRLAQDASRFRAMSQANDTANDSASALRTQYYHAKRAVIDQRLREIISGLKQVRSHAR